MLTSDSSDTGGCGNSNPNDTKQDAISNWSSLSNNTDSTEVFVHPATVIPTSYKNNKRDFQCTNKDSVSVNIVLNIIWNIFFGTCYIALKYTEKSILWHYIMKNIYTTLQ